MADDQVVAELERSPPTGPTSCCVPRCCSPAAVRPAEDLLQSALERLLRHWAALDGDPEAYLRRTLYNLATDGYRGKARCGTSCCCSGPRPGRPADPAAQVDLRDALIRLLLQLPPRHGAVLVCRYWEQLTEAETAELLGWPEGTGPIRRVPGAAAAA